MSATFTRVNGELSLMVLNILSLTVLKKSDNCIVLYCYYKIAYFRPSLNKHFHIVIAVSGASGFLGSYVVCMLLEKGKQVRAFRRASSAMGEFETIFNYYFQHQTPEQLALLKQQLTWVIADVNDIPSLDDALTDVSEVYHCAAIVSFVKKEKDNLMKVNVEGTKNM